MSIEQNCDTTTPAKKWFCHHVFVCRISNWSAVVRVGSTRRWLRLPRKVHSILLRGFPDKKNGELRNVPTWDLHPNMMMLWRFETFLHFRSRPWAKLVLVLDRSWSLFFIWLVFCLSSLTWLFNYVSLGGKDLQSTGSSFSLTGENYPIFHSPGLTHPVVTWQSFVDPPKPKPAHQIATLDGCLKGLVASFFRPEQIERYYDILWDTAYVYSIYIHLVPHLVEKKRGPLFVSTYTCYPIYIHYSI